MYDDPSKIVSMLKKQISEADLTFQARNEGVIINLHDGIATIYGLDDVLAGEMIRFNDTTYGIAFNLEREIVGAIVFGDYETLSEGGEVRCTGKVLDIPVSEHLLGRVVDALGNPIDGKGEITFQKRSAVEKIAPGVMWRQSVDEPLYSGIKAIDTMIPIGRGQRELIIGDRKTGKTAIAVDTIINQRTSDVICVYVAIGQKNSSIAALVKKLEESKAMQYSVIVVAGASDSAAIQYIAPFTGCTIGEYFRDLGEDALVVYDDLSKHAWAYRQLALLLRRPPGREAYPGDIFYLHSRLLERASRVNVKYIEINSRGSVKGKGGSLTALPIIETQAGDITAFVPTNVISITDGQIFLEEDLFNAGIRPAINVGLSVSRVGGAAQTDIIKNLSSDLRLVLAQFRELESFAQFASDLDEATRKQLEHGQRALEMLKQKQYAPQSLAEMVISLYVIKEDFLADITLDKISQFEHMLHLFMRDQYQDLMQEIAANPIYSAGLIERIKNAVLAFKEKGGYFSVLYS